MLYSVRQWKLIQELSLEQWKELHPAFEADLHEALAPRAVVSARRSEGGTGFDRVHEQLMLWQERLKESAVG